MLKKTLLTIGSLMIMSATAAAPAMAADPENTLVMEVSSGGNVVIELRPDLAPQHVERIKTLTREGFYDGIIFHRVIDGFMAQTGDPTGTGTGGSKYPDLPSEFTKTNFGRGTLGMARAASPHSANSQFFICFEDCGFLNGQYTVFGEVKEGMEFIDKVAKGEPPASPDKIVKMQVQADANKPAEAAAPAPAATPAAADPAAVPAEVPATE